MSCYRHFLNEKYDYPIFHFPVVEKVKAPPIKLRI